MEIPIWEKYLLTREEASAYFLIGVTKLSEWIDSNPKSDCLLWNGTRALIKRKKFEKYLDEISVI